MREYPDTLALREALAQHYAVSGFPDDGGYSARWVKVTVLGIPLGFPNIPARRAVVRYHDIHHVLTGYATDWVGEMEIGAFEIASLSRDTLRTLRFWVAWGLNLSILAIGAVARPRRTFTAWCRGRRSGNLYGQPLHTIEDHRVGELRQRIALDCDDRPPRPNDLLTFLAWGATGAVLNLAPFLFVGILTWSLCVHER